MIYKYRDWNDKNHKKILFDNELWFSSPSNFNDPYDSVIPLRYDKLTDKEFLTLMKESINLEFNKSPRIIKRDEYRKVQKFLKKNKHYKTEFMNIKYPIILNQFIKILSLSKIPNNILMWSHYSNNHTGICLGFDEEKLEIDLKNNKNRLEAYQISIVDINYSYEIPIIKPKLKENDVTYNLFEPLLITKHTNWNYEKEKRIIIFKSNKNKYYYSSDTLKECYLGCKMEKDKKAEVIEILKKSFPNCKIFEYQRSFDKFELLSKQIY